MTPLFTSSSFAFFAYTSDWWSNSTVDHESSLAGCLPATFWARRGLFPGPRASTRPGRPGRPLRRPPMRLGFHGHHQQPQAGGGAAFLQRVLGERRATGLQLRRAVLVLDPHGDLRAGPGGKIFFFFRLNVAHNVNCS